jgi:hypothetical protein
VLADAPVLSAILVMRVYALYFQNKLVLAIVGVEALAAMGIGFVSTFLHCDQDVHISTSIVGYR